MAMVLEVCVDSLGAAKAAQAGGATRLELCSALPLGGLSPDLALFDLVRQAVDLPIHALLRPRAGDFLYDEDEFALLCRQTKELAQRGADAIVIGAVTPQGRLDTEKMEQLMELAPNCKVTLHRAFDVTRDPYEALEDACRLGVSWILTSGQQNSCTQGADLLKNLVQQAGDRTQILIGAGVNAEAIRMLAPYTGAEAFHLSGKYSVPSGMKFRRESVSMGAAGMDEYEISRCSAKAIAAAREALEQAMRERETKGGVPV